MDSSDSLQVGMKLSEDEPFAYNTLIPVFRYLDFKDLLSCAQVCEMWRWIANDDSLWRFIVVRCCTKHIEDITNIYGGKIRNLELINAKLLPLEILENISSKLVNLRRIKLFGCHKNQLKLFAKNHKSLERIYAEVNWGNLSMELDYIDNLSNLTNLEIITHIDVREIDNIKKLLKLKHLVFHAPCDQSCWEHIAEVENLESLSLDANMGFTWDLGLFECDFLIRNLKHLNKLEINDLPYFHEYDILEKIKDLPNIKELILLNISISRAGTSSFGRLLGDCHSIEKLTISIFRVVFYTSILDVALENTEIVNGVTALKGSLKVFCWIMDPSGLSSVKEFYHLDNATALKVDRNKPHVKMGTKSAFIEGLSPITMKKLFSVLQKRLPNTKVSLLGPERNYVKEQCFTCTEKARTAQDRMRTYT